MVPVICFGDSGHRRIGFHRYGKIGRAIAYGRRVIQVVACVYCDRLEAHG